MIPDPVQRIQRGLVGIGYIRLNGQTDMGID